MIRTHRARKLRVSEKSHDLEKIELPLIRKHFLEIVQSSADVAHMYLVYFPSFTQVSDNRRISVPGFFNPYWLSPDTVEIRCKGC